MVLQDMAVRDRPIADLATPGAQFPDLPRSAPRPAALRRRRILAALGGLTGIALIAAVGSGVAAAWWALLAMIAVGAGYLLLLHHVRQVRAEEEFANLLGEPHPDPFAALAARPARPRSDTPVVARRAPSQTWSLVKFVLASAAGWALAPVVFGLTLLLGETPRDATGQRWLANLRGAQERLRDGSMRTLAISAATTASVAAGSTVAALGGTGMASAATLTSAPGGGGYVVVAGDTLATIAARFGTTVAAMASANHLADPNLIYAGQRLVIPGGSAPSPSTGPSWGAPAGSTYVVVAGDTLGTIAARFGTTVAALAAINHLADPNLIYAGQVLSLTGVAAGGGSGGGGTGGTATGWTTPAPAPSRPAASGGGTYVVVAGDTLGSIAARFGTSVAALAAANHLSNPNLIYAGEVLVLTAGAAPSPAPAAPSPAPAPVSAPASSSAAIAVRAALEQVGKPYQWAGAGPNSFDCSGLVMYAWAQAGVSLPHYSVAQYEDTTRISASQLEPGDLVFYNTGSGAEPGHVTIYIGNGQIVTADSPGTVVRVEVVDWDGIPMGYGRVR